MIVVNDPEGSEERFRVAAACTAPAFQFQHDRGVWGVCTGCGTYAWDHPQSDPIADIRNQMREIRDRLPAGSFPPAMKDPGG